ncbi:hypothetical protein [Streptomyces catenulae]|uniref:Uncharacterized protein n=1 Tax=Streptomyces catenulae TaxID=66875 RepID=A0ABV2Z4Z3_9ACTN|nr:hypothetical protein [Streptomyces catenulae]
MRLRRALSASAATATLIPVLLAAAPASAAPAALPKCSDVGKESYSFLDGRVFGIPESITLGTDWTTYTATLTNSSKKELTSFTLTAELGSFVYNPGEKDLSPYGDLQYWDTARNAWQPLRRADGDAGGTVPAPKALKPRESVHLQLRFRVGEDLPMDHSYDAYTGLTGSFADTYHGTDCTDSGSATGGFSPREA